VVAGMRLIVVDCKFLEDGSLEIKHVEIGALA